VQDRVATKFVPEIINLAQIYNAARMMIAA